MSLSCTVSDMLSIIYQKAKEVMQPEHIPSIVHALVFVNIFN